MRGALPLAIALALGCKDPGRTPAPLWGPPVADDHDPDPDVVEVHLLAGAGPVDLGGAARPELWTYNGTFPGPVLRMTEGQTLRVELRNALLDSATSLHWHGLRVPNEVDGVSLVQAPVEAGETRVIELVPPDPGTHWYHPHIRSHEQVGRGLYGAILIEEADATPVDQERLFVLDDLDLTPDGELAPFELEGGSVDAVLGELGNTIFVNGQDAVTEPLRADTTSGAVERWRLVNAANARTMHLQVRGAAWRVIARDGTLLPQPYETDTVDIASGQRFDLEVHPGADDVELVLTFEPVPGTIYEYPLYVGETSGEELPPEAFLDFGASALPPLTDPTDELALVLGGELVTSSTVWTINGVVFDAGEDHEEHDHEWIHAPFGTPTLVRIENDTDYEHPFHIHGHSFQVLSFDGAPPAHRMLLDTILVPPRVDVELHATFDNPGYWMAHCHILEHAELGMMTVLEVIP